MILNYSVITCAQVYLLSSVDSIPSIFWHFLKILGCVKNTWTNTRLVCTHLNAFLMLKPNMVMKIWIEKKKMKCCLLLTPTWRVKYTRHGSYSFFVLLKFDVFPPQFQRLVTRTADPIPVISVLIWMHFSYGI